MEWKSAKPHSGQQALSKVGATLPPHRLLYFPQRMVEGERVSLLNEGGGSDEAGCSWNCHAPASAQHGLPTLG